MSYSQPPYSPQPQQYDVQRKTNVLAIVSLVTSIVGVYLAGIITGHIGLSQIKRTGESGRGLALAGVIIGYVGFFVIGGSILAAIAIPIFLGQQNQAQDASTKSDLTNLRTAVIAYGVANGVYPTDADIGNGTLAQYGFSQSQYTEEIRILSADGTSICLGAASTTGRVFYVTQDGGISEEPCN